MHLVQEFLLAMYATLIVILSFYSQRRDVTNLFFFLFYIYNILHSLFFIKVHQFIYVKKAIKLFGLSLCLEDSGESF